MNTLVVMRKLKYFIFLLFICFSFTECADVVQIKLDEGSELVVIDAFLESQFDAQAIFIHKNTGYFGNEKPEPIVNAYVTLHDLTAVKSYKFNYVREDRYEIFLEKASFVVGHQYKLEVIVNGNVYSAITTQPRGAQVDSISVSPFTKDQFTGEPKPLYYMCYMWAKDKADNNPDYYWVKANDDSPSYNLCIDGTIGAVKNAEQDSIYFAAPFTLLGFKTYWPGQLAGAYVNAITKPTYDFLIQAQAQINNGGMFATTPENVKTNFVSPAEAKTKAVGWFSVATVSKAFKQIPG